MGCTNSSPSNVQPTSKIKTEKEKSNETSKTKFIIRRKQKSRKN